MRAAIFAATILFLFSSPSLAQDAKRNASKITSDDKAASVVAGTTIMGMSLLCFGFAAVASLLFYFMPTFVGFVRGHSNLMPIFIVNFFLGWLLVGWVVALAWAFTAEDKPKYRRRYTGVILLVCLAAIGCNNRGDALVSPKQSSQVKDSVSPASIMSSSTSKKDIAKLGNYSEFIVKLKKDVPLNVAEFKSSPWKAKAVSYDIDPDSPEIFRTLTISITPPVYLSDPIISPAWFSKAVLHSGPKTAFFPDGAPGASKNQSVFSGKQPVMMDPTGWASVELLN